MTPLLHDSIGSSNVEYPSAGMLKLIVNSIGEGTSENDDRSYDIFSQTLGL